MEMFVNVNNERLSYHLKDSRRSRRVRIAVNCDGTVLVTKPYFFNLNKAVRLVESKADWILSKVKYFQKFERRSVPEVKANDKKYHEEALELVQRKLACYNNLYQYRFNKISVKNIKTRWGSCSRKSNLNFNLKIIFLPERLIDYIVVHELCHLREFNHSKAFWRLVSETIPDYAVRRRELRKLILYEKK